jgi:hypothetical protein
LIDVIEVFTLPDVVSKFVNLPLAEDVNEFRLVIEISTLLLLLSKFDNLEACEPVSEFNPFIFAFNDADTLKNEDDTSVYLGISANCPACCISEPVIIGLSKIISPFYYYL